MRWTLHQNTNAMRWMEWWTEHHPNAVITSNMKGHARYIMYKSDCINTTKTIAQRLSNDIVYLFKCKGSYHQSLG